MGSRWLLTAGLLALAAGCGGEAGSAGARLSQHRAVPGDLPEPVQFEAGRNFVAEYEELAGLVNQQHVDPAAIRGALGVEPTRTFSYKTVDGSELFGWEFEPKGPDKGAPFFEAFAQGYPGQSFFVFFEKSWFSWHAVDCGFHERGAFGQTASLP